VGYGFAPISYDRPDDEYAYLEANRVWLERKRIEAFVDFLQTRAEMNSHRQR
jgi:hypothetical protein